ncbi:MAG: formylglycine-generating enzyme family protein, partial [Pirellulaceae bacterium]
GQYDLTQMIAAQRQGHGIAAGDKLLVVLDQFEQWLNSHRDDLDDSELVRALRQCDGESVQCIVMVRDDFWMAATRFMRALEIRLIEAENSASVDLFQPGHARKVLRAYGRAFGDLPQASTQISKGQTQFVKQAVDGLTEEGTVVCVRLALFAEMFKGKSWAPSTLKDLGGTEGVGVAFLEETFSAKTAPPAHRYHQRAARAILKALLPGIDSEIRGNVRSQDELLEASGYRERPDDFKELLRILDAELRLITPTEDAVGDVATRHSSPSTKFYQLTHDYLVPALRTWLTRKQKETRRGRAELKLAERSDLWNANTENRFLPSLPEWVRIRTLTDKTQWTEPQRRMMKKAGRVRGVRASALALVLTAIVLGGLIARNAMVDRRQQLIASKEEEQNDAEATRLVEGLLQADTSSVSSIIEDLGNYRSWTGDELREAFATSPDDSNAKLHAALALLDEDGSVLEFLRERLLTVAPFQFASVRDLLSGHKQNLTADYWQIARNDLLDDQRRFQAACALATFDPDNSHWSEPGFSEFMARHLVNVLPSQLLPWRETLQPVKQHLSGPLADIYRSRDEGEQARSFATDTLADYFSNDAESLFGLLVDADERQFPVVFDKLKVYQDQAIQLGRDAIASTQAVESGQRESEEWAVRLSNSVIMLLRMNMPDRVWPLLTHGPNPRVRSYVIERAGPLGVDPVLIVNQYKRESDVSIRRALLLCLGQFSESQLSDIDRAAFVDTLLDAYRNDADAGLHGAADWLLRLWGQNEEVATIDNQLQQAARQTDANTAVAKQWFVNGEGQTFSILNGAQFLMGSPESEAGRQTDEVQHPVKINRQFAISTREVTRQQFLKFRESFTHDHMHRYPEPDCPIGGVLWYEAAAYCNWLSEQEGIPADQWCYEPNEQGEYGPGMTSKANFLELAGYRLPTESEWEFACRAGTNTARFYGQIDSLLPRYAFSSVNSGDVTWPVASLKPNDSGLFDIQGNVYEWCFDAYAEYPVDLTTPVYDAPEAGEVEESLNRVIRGGSFDNRAMFVRSAYRFQSFPGFRYYSFGFRLAKTTDSEGSR